MRRRGCGGRFVILPTQALAAQACRISQIQQRVTSRHDAACKRTTCRGVTRALQERTFSLGGYFGGISAYPGAAVLRFGASIPWRRRWPSGFRRRADASEIVLPVFGTVTDRGVENPALAVHAGPNHRIGRPLVGVAVHRGGIQRADDVQIRREVLQRIPFFFQAHGLLTPSKPRKFWIVDDHVCRLQARILVLPVEDEFAAQHADVRIRLVAMRDVRFERSFGVGRGVKRVAAAWTPTNPIPP